MSAHRFWRLHVTRTGGSGSTVTVGELILASTPGGNQAAVGGTATASSVLGTNAASRAFDGTLAAGNFWQCASGSLLSGVGSEFIQYDMGANNSISVEEMRLYYDHPTSPTTFPNDFGLYHSDDGIQWTFRRNWTGQSFTNGETKTYAATPVTPQVFRVFEHNLIGRGFQRVTAPVVQTPWTGNFYIAGTTTVLGVPHIRRVDLIDQRSGVLVRSLTTKSDGVFLFDNIGPGPWTVVGVDVTATHNSVIFAHVVPIPMT